jgi:hypothetical protein
VAHHAPHAGEHQRGAGPVPGEHVVGTTLVGRFAVGHRADDSDLVGDLGRLWQEFAELLPADFGVDRAKLASILDGCVRLGVERLLRRHTPREEDVDDALGDFGQGGWPLRLRLTQIEELRQAETQPRESSDRQKSATTGTVRGGHPVVSLKDY